MKWPLLLACVPALALATPADDEKLAAIQKAMNDLSPAVQQCWAQVAAAERFDVHGELAAQIDIAAPPHVAIVRDTTQSPTLAACVTRVLVAYRWAPPLAGQSIQLPFKFSAPDGQSVVDRRLVPDKGQGKVSIAVLLDASTTGNAAASLLGVTIAAGGSTGWRWTDRDELWYFPTPIAVGGLAPASLVWVGKGAARTIAAGAQPLHAVLVVAPGGREGVARAGALDNREVTGVRSAPMGPSLTRPEHSPIASAAHVHLDDRGAHPVAQTELWFVEAGHGTLTIAGTDVAVDEHSVVQIPANVATTFRGSIDLLQVFVK